MQCSEFSYNGLTAANRVRSPNGLYATIQTKVVTRKLKGKNEGFSVGDDIYNTEILICTCMYCIFWVLVKFNLKIYFSMTYVQLQEKEDSQKIKQRGKINLKFKYQKDMLQLILLL